MPKTHLTAAIIFCGFVLFAPLAAHACPGCAAALSKSLGSAFNASVLFMMATPFTLFGAFVVGFIMLNRHARKTPSRAKRASRSESQQQENFQRID